MLAFPRTLAPGLGEADMPKITTHEEFTDANVDFGQDCTYDSP